MCVCVCVCVCVWCYFVGFFHLAFFSSFRVTSRGIECPCDVCTDGKEQYCHINPGGRVGGMILGWIGV